MIDVPKAATSGPTTSTSGSLRSGSKRALQQWLAQPAPFPRIQNEASIRLLGGDLADDEVIVSSLRAMRSELDALDTDIDHSAAIASLIPERTKYLLLLHRYGRRLVAIHREWIEEVERELGR